MSMIEIILYGRGGQGVVTAGELLARAAVLDGKFGQSIPFYGGERRGAPVVSYVRLSDKPIRMHRNVKSPEMVAIFDPSLFNVSNPLSGLKENGTVVINAPEKNDKVEKGFYINANKIAEDLKLVIAGWPVVNTIMMGAVAKATNIISKDALDKAIEETFEGNMVEQNKKGAEYGFNEVVQIG
ncbi:MAG: 2-oxoacid:acceptor oxidoreductase family protein [Candidatus Micrarchaeia archaeon]